MSPDDSRRRLVLLAVAETAGRKTGQSVDVEEVLAFLPAGVLADRDSLEDELSLLIDRHLLDGFKSLGGLNQVFLRPQWQARTRRDLSSFSRLGLLGS